MRIDAMTPGRQIAVSRSTRQQPARDHGFALIAVIWIASLLAVVASVFTTSVRSTVRDVHASVAMEEAAALAETGINLVLLDAIKARASDAARRFPADGTTLVCRTGDSDLLAIRLRDEAGKVDLNVAKAELLHALFTGIGLKPSDADSVRDALADYKDSDDDQRLNGAEAETYRQSGRPSGPKNAALDAVDELGQVYGMTSPLAARVRPFVTIHSGQDGVDPKAAAPELVALLARGSEGDGGFAAVRLSDRAALPPAFVTASAKRTFTIEAEAMTSRGARYVREAIVNFTDRARQAEGADAAGRRAPPLPVTILSWRRATSFADVPSDRDPAEVPPC